MLAIAREAFPLAMVPRAREPGGVPLRSASAATGGPSSGREGGDGGGRDAGKRSGGGDAGPAGDDRASGGEGNSTTAAGEPAAPGSESYAPTADEEGGLRTAHYVGASFALLVAGLGAGFLLYRRRLP